MADVKIESKEACCSTEATQGCCGTDVATDSCCGTGSTSFC